MDMDVVKKCAEMAAQHFKNAFNTVPEDVQALLDELNAPPVVEEEPTAKPTRKAK
jgi:hypothetical protein